MALIFYVILSVPLAAVIVYAIATAITTATLPAEFLRMALCASPFLLLGPFFIVLWCRWKIIVKGDRITYCTYFGRERTCQFSYITTVKRGFVPIKNGYKDVLRAYHGKEKLFALTPICPGFNILAARLMGEGVRFIGIYDKIVD